MYYCFCTESYAGWLIMMVRSLRRVDKRRPIFVHFDGDIPALSRALAGLPALFIETPVEAPCAGMSPAALLIVRARNVLAVARERSFPWLMVMDADLLVRRSLAPLYRPMGLYDFGAVIRSASDGGPLPPHLQVSAALSVVTKRGLPILEEANRLMAEEQSVRGIHRGEWYWDQACLAEAVLTSDLRIRSIPREIYLSSRPFDRRAAVWNGNFSGGRKLAAFRAFEVEFGRLSNRGPDRRV